MKRFTSVQDMVDGPGLKAAIKTAHAVTEDPYVFDGEGARKTLGLLFMNPSLRTRMSTQIAANRLGMDVIVLNAGGDSWTLETADGAVMDGGKTEHIKDAAAVMGRYCDILGIRTFAGLQDREADYTEQILESFIRYSGIPVLSLESATRHPLQSFADLITIAERTVNRRPKVVLTWAPHPKALPQAVANSFSEWMRQADADLTIAFPEGYALSDEFMQGATVTHDQDDALDHADIVYAKNWSSYEDYGKILSTDSSWMITEEKMAHTNAAAFMHCLPVRRNVIVTDEVLDGPASIVTDQAAHRITSAQTVLHYMLQELK